MIHEMVPKHEEHEICVKMNFLLLDVSLGFVKDRRQERTIIWKLYSCHDWDPSHFTTQAAELDAVPPTTCRSKITLFASHADSQEDIRSFLVSTELLIAILVHL